MFYRRFGLSLFAAGAVVASLAAVPASAGSIVVIANDAMNPSTATFGGASPVATDRTVQHWFGQTLDTHNGITYGYNMVGLAPSSNSSSTIPVDIIPLNLNVAGSSFNGVDKVPAIVASPLFQTGSYATTSAATAVDGTKGAGGKLSAGNTGVQLEDATMRSQFNKVGTGYHVVLGQPVIHDAVTIDVPSNHGVLGTRSGGAGVVFADVNINWFAAQLQNLNTSLGYIDPTHLPLYVTNDVMLYIGSNPANCCVIGFHGASKVTGFGLGSVNSNGNSKILTYAWASWVLPGTFRTQPTATHPADWALQDIHAFSHEVSEWADDPFINNTVEPWLTPTAPQYGCTSFLETGDPVVSIGFSQGVNTTDQGPSPDGQQVADGTYHPEDEALLPWFTRNSPNLISQPTQTRSANIGRYTLMGDLNPYPGFRQPATGC